MGLLCTFGRFNEPVLPIRDARAHIIFNQEDVFEVIEFRLQEKINQAVFIGGDPNLLGRSGEGDQSMREFFF